MRHKLFGLMLAFLLIGLASMSQGSQIFLDEDFEGAAAFVDQNWPIKDQTETAPSVTPKGANLRSYDSSETYTSPKPNYANTGSIVSSRFFKGTKSLQLASGQSVKVTGPIVARGTGEARLFQFALSTNAATAALPSGTQVGHFKFDWSITTTSSGAEASLVLSFVVNAEGKVDIKCQNNNAVIGSLTGASGDWLLISLLTNSRVVVSPPHAGAIWRIYDPFTSTYKGPQPLNPKADPAAMTDADFRTVGAGVQIYVNDTDSTITKVLPEEMGAGWGNDNADTAGDPRNSAEQGWELVAENGGTLFVDDMYWDLNVHGSATRPMEQEAGGRMAAFNEATVEPKEFVASSKTWDLY